jgi:hypothetical protein
MNLIFNLVVILPMLLGKSQDKEPSTANPDPKPAQESSVKDSVSPPAAAEKATAKAAGQVKNEIPPSPFPEAGSDDIRLALSSFILAGDGKFRLVINYQIDKEEIKKINLSRLGEFLIPSAQGNMKFELLRADKTEIIIRGPDGTVYNFL